MERDIFERLDFYMRNSKFRIISLILSTVLFITTPCAVFAEKIAARSAAAIPAPYFKSSSYGVRNPFAASGYYGQCTWYAWGRVREVTGVSLPSGLGNAGDWLARAKAMGLTVLSANTVPVPGCVAVWKGKPRLIKEEATTAETAETGAIRLQNGEPEKVDKKAAKPVVKQPAKAKAKTAKKETVASDEPTKSEAAEVKEPKEPRYISPLGHVAFVEAVNGRDITFSHSNYTTTTYGQVFTLEDGLKYYSGRVTMSADAARSYHGELLGYIYPGRGVNAAQPMVMSSLYERKSSVPASKVGAYVLDVSEAAHTMRDGTYTLRSETGMTVAASATGFRLVSGRGFVTLRYASGGKYKITLNNTVLAGEYYILKQSDNENSPVVFVNAASGMCLAPVSGAAGSAVVQVSGTALGWWRLGS